MIRQLHPFHSNLKKRLVKSPKIYLRDSGLLHSLLRLQQVEDLAGHPSLGASWEGWVIEQTLAVIPAAWTPWFYRTSAGAEMDLVLQRPGQKPPLALDVKYSLNPVPTKGFWSALTDLSPAKAYVVYPGKESYPLNGGVWTLPVSQLCDLIQSLES